MIRVRRGRPPNVLRNGAAAARQALSAAYSADPASFNGGKQFTFADGLYAHSEVRARLSKNHCKKCCYCEVIIPVPYASTHVEHFRPKAYSQQGRGTPKRYPGYYWLAYEWTNLYLSCQFCNVSQKRNIFPLGSPAHRATKDGDVLALEGALLIDPGVEDPRVGVAAVGAVHDRGSPLSDRTHRTVDKAVDNTAVTVHNNRAGVHHPAPGVD